MFRLSHLLFKLPKFPPRASRDVKLPDVKLPDAKLPEYSRASRDALAWLENRDFKAEMLVQAMFGQGGFKHDPDTTSPRMIGMSSCCGTVGYRVEFDTRSGAHINVWDKRTIKYERFPHFQFWGSEKTVTRICHRLFGRRGGTPLAQWQEQHPQSKVPSQTIALNKLITE